MYTIILELVQAEELVNETVDVKVQTVHYTLTVLPSTVVKEDGLSM